MKKGIFWSLWTILTLIAAVAILWSRNIAGAETPWYVWTAVVAASLLNVILLVILRDDGLLFLVGFVAIVVMAGYVIGFFLAPAMQYGVGLVDYNGPGITVLASSSVFWAAFFVPFGTAYYGYGYINERDKQGRRKKK